MKRLITFKNYKIVFDDSNVMGMDYKDGTLVIVMDNKDFLVNCDEKVATQIMNSYLKGEDSILHFDEELKTNENTFTFLSELVKQEAESGDKTVPKFLRG